MEIVCPIHGKQDSRKWPKFQVAGLRFGACGKPVNGRAVDVPMPDTGDRMPGACYVVRDKCGFPLFAENGDPENNMTLDHLKEYIKKHKGLFGRVAEQFIDTDEIVKKTKVA